MDEQNIYLIKKSGIENFRDLGGYRTAKGQSVRKSKLYRTAALVALSDDNKQFLDGLALGTVFDFRSTAEVTKNPDYVPAGALYLNQSGIKSMEKDDCAGNLDMVGQIGNAAASPEVMGMLETFLQNSYGNMVEEPDAFKEFFIALLNKPEMPMLYHCTAGKDRTGVATAFLLKILGVRDETIWEDYLLSKKYREKEINDTMIELKKKVQDERVQELVKEMLGVEKKFLQCTFSKIDELYGGFDAFVQRGLGVDDDGIKILQENFLD